MLRSLVSRAVDMNETLASITNWSQDSNLVLNPVKTKCMLFTTPQMSSYHSLAEHPIHLSVGDKPLERVHSIKLLEVHMTDTLKWDDHVKHPASSCYGVLATLLIGGNTRKASTVSQFHNSQIFTLPIKTHRSQRSHYKKKKTKTLHFQKPEKKLLLSG